MESKKNYTNELTKQKLKNLENTLMVTKEERQGERYKEFGVNKQSLLNIKETTGTYCIAQGLYSLSCNNL